VASVVWLGEGSGNVLATRIQKRCCGDNSYKLVRNRQTTTHDYFIFCSVVLVAVSWPDIDLAAIAMHYYLWRASGRTHAALRPVASVPVFSQ
jgi:hypothetical protein